MKPVKWLSAEVTKHVRPVIRDFMIHVYEHPEEYLEPDPSAGGTTTNTNQNQLIKFQLALKKIPNWTNTQIKKQIDEINVRCTWFKKLLVALFVSYIKMLSDGIRTSSKTRRLDVKLPSDETFVHTCFVDAAHNLYENPYVMKKSELERDRELDERIQQSIMNSIDKLIPTADIINNYIPSTSDDLSYGDGCGEEEEEEPQTTDAVAGAAGAAGAVAAGAGAPPPPSADEEPKTIEVPKDGGESENEDDLFPDAPDKISTKINGEVHEKSS